MKLNTFNFETSKCSLSCSVNVICNRSCERHCFAAVRGEIIGTSLGERTAGHVSLLPAAEQTARCSGSDGLTKLYELM